MVDVAQLCVFIRMVFEDMSTKEELLTILPLKGHTRGEDIFNAFMGFVNEKKLTLFKLISITTDGAPAMVGRTSGFIALCKESESFPDILNYHCIIHQQALCGKILNMKEVGPGVCREGFSVLTWRRMVLSTQTCCFTRMLGG